MSRVARVARPHARVVVVLGWVSFWNDTASEMLTPLLPLFLTTTLGAGPAIVGVVEGIAEATASVLKFVSGRLADRGWPARGLVLGGYSVSNAARPLLGLATGWGHVLTLRFADRVGKGVRTAPRDALITGATSPDQRGRAFGFQRAMDHAGSTLGPVAAFLLLHAGVSLRSVFLASIVPGVLVLALLGFGLPREPRAARPAAAPPLRWRGLDPHVRALVLAAGGLALATTPEAFLVLWAAERGLALAWVPILWAVVHGAKALVATPAGRLSDRVGRLLVVGAGWAARIAVLLALATAPDGPWLAWLLFPAYGVALASTEAAERALIGDLAPAAQKATAFGLYHLSTGILALPGAVLFGAIWQRFGSAPAFLTAAGLTALAAGTLVAIARRGSARP
ncbi:MFS transporter [Myxococcota bacterium]|nr:MFS transporter [Myxococcota bacterium]